MTTNKMTRLGFLSASAALFVAAILYFAACSSEETDLRETPQGAPAPSAVNDARDIPQNKGEAEPPEDTAPSALSSSEPGDKPPPQRTGGIESEAAQETPQSFHAKTALETLGPDLERWLQIARMQLEERGEQGAELERMLEWRRKAMESMDPSGWEEFLDNSGIAIWKWNPHLSDRQNRIYQKLYQLNGSTDYPKGSEKTPPEIIEILVEGLDDLTAAEKLRYPRQGWGWKSEPEYARMYLERALAKDPTSREALILKTSLYTDEEKYAAARRLIELYPDDEKAVRYGGTKLTHKFPEEAISALERIAPKDERHWSHLYLSYAYERLDMIDMAIYHNQFADTGRRARFIVSHEIRRFPSIWEERAAAAAEAGTQTTSSESPKTPQRQPDAPDPPDAPRGMEPPPPPPGAKMDMAAAYADFAKAYQDVFEMEYGLSEATPEGYMNALLGMARAFARAGDAQHAQDVYNAVRKRHSREEVEQVFRRLDDQERLKRHGTAGAPSENDEENADSGEDE